MKTEAEIRAALKLMVNFMDSGGGATLRRETVVQVIGLVTALGWVLGEEVIPGETGVMPAVLEEMKKNMQAKCN